MDVVIIKAGWGKMPCATWKGLPGRDLLCPVVFSLYHTGTLFIYGSIWMPEGMLLWTPCLSSLSIYLELRSERPVAAQYQRQCPTRLLQGLSSIGDLNNLAAVRLDKTNLRMESRQTVKYGNNME